MISYDADYIIGHWRQMRDFNTPKPQFVTNFATGRLINAPPVPAEPIKQYPFNGKWPTRIYYKITYKVRKRKGQITQKPPVVYVGKPSVSAIRRMYNSMTAETIQVTAAEFDRKQLLEYAHFDRYQHGMPFEFLDAEHPLHCNHLPQPIFKSYHFFETEIRGIFSSFMKSLEAKKLAGQQVYRPANTTLTVAQVKAAHAELARLGFKKTK